jgi:hypothetical protein
MAEAAQSYASPLQTDENGSANSSPGPSQPGEALALNEGELDATFQLLVERAQYITGATGTALALPQGTDMVCRASAGSCAPKVGACLQVRSGLTGESILRRQLLRCDNAETDPRVNIESCRTLGIASIVVLPLLRPNGEVRGLFELFADHPYAFEERDLIALERLADLTTTALDLAEKNEPSPSAPVKTGIDVASADATASVMHDAKGSTVADDKSTRPTEVKPGAEETAEPATAVELRSAAAAASASAAPAAIGSLDQPTGPAGAPQMARLEEPVARPEDKSSPETPSPASTPESLRGQKCSGCGFPVSGGRTLCLDCEQNREAEKDELRQSGGAAGLRVSEPQGATDELLPAFLSGAKPVKQTWFSNPVNLLALAVVILGVAVIIVVFR